MELLTPNFLCIDTLPEKTSSILKTLKALLAKGFIRVSKSAWASPVLIAKKKTDDGAELTEMRLCTDYRKLNSKTKKSRYPLPGIHELLDRLHKAKCFSKFDFRSGYLQIRVAEESIPLAAFRTKYGQYEYTVMNFGLCNAPGTLQTLVNDIFIDHIDDFVLAYFGEILGYSDDWESHIQHLRQVLEILRTNKLYTSDQNAISSNSPWNF